MFTKPMNLVLTPAQAGLDRSEIDAVRASVAKFSEFVSRISEYSRDQARKDYVDAKAAACERGDLVEIEALGDFAAFEKKYESVAANLTEALQAHQRNAHKPLWQTLLKIDKALERVVLKAEHDEKDVADRIGVPWSPSSGCLALRKELGRYRAQLENAPAHGIELSDLGKFFFDAE